MSDSNSLGGGQKSGTGAKIEYYATTPRRVLFLSAITFGVYQFYWFYRNWQLIKAAEKSKISPIGRAILFVFYCHSLFKKIMQSASDQGYVEQRTPGMLAASYIILVIAGDSMSRIETNDLLFNFIWLAATVCSAIPLMFVQRAINFNNERITKREVVAKKFTIGEWVLVVLGVLFFIFTVLDLALLFA